MALLYSERTRPVICFSLIKLVSAEIAPFIPCPSTWLPKPGLPPLSLSHKLSTSNTRMREAMPSYDVFEYGGDGAGQNPVIEALLRSVPSIKASHVLALPSVRMHWIWGAM